MNEDTLHWHGKASEAKGPECNLQSGGSVIWKMNGSVEDFSLNLTFIIIPSNIYYKIIFPKVNTWEFLLILI